MLHIRLIFHFFLLKVLNSLNKIIDHSKFDAFINYNAKKIILSKFSPRYPFIDRTNPLSKMIFRDDPNNRYGHEPELCHLLDMLLKNDDTFLDIGSASGYFSIYVCSRKGFSGKCIAFEPQKQMFDIINKLKKGLGYEDKIFAHNFAISNKKGSTGFLITPDTGNSYITNNKKGKGEFIKIKTETLDNLKMQRVNFLKIDVEAFEKEVIEGGVNTISRDKPYLFIESWITDKDKEGKKIFYLLEKLNYKLFLPGWLQKKSTFHIGIGPNFDMKYFSLFPIHENDRKHFPTNPINIFACHISKIKNLGVSYNNEL